MRPLKAFYIGAAFLLAAAAAQASTILTFDNGPFLPFTPYVENGYQVDDGGWYIAADGAMHFDIYLGPYGIGRTITSTTATPFNLHSLDIISLFPNVATGGIIGGPLDDMLFTGYRGAAAVATAYASSQIGNSTFLFGSAFSNLTSLTILGFDAGNLDFSQGVSDIHFLIDNLEVSAIPLPATATMLLAGLGGLVLARRRGCAEKR